jgi:predicted DNA-binding transcriptional regulator AlpA
MAKKAVDDFEDRRVLTVPEFRERNKISKTTWWRLKQAGETPRLISLTRKLKGVTLGEERRWQESRMSEAQ